MEKRAHTRLAVSHAADGEKGTCMEETLLVSKDKPKKDAVFIAMSATLVTAVPALILSPSQLAQAQAGRFIEGNGRGQVNRPPVGGEPGASIPGDESIFFLADKHKRSLFGSSQIATDLASKSGTLNGGNIGGKQFALKVIEDGDSTNG
jgi:hypothetical protein